MAGSNLRGTAGEALSDAYRDELDVFGFSPFSRRDTARVWS